MRKSLINATLISSHEISIVYLNNGYSSFDSLKFYLVSDKERTPLKAEINRKQSIPEIKLFSEKEIILGVDYKIETNEEESVYIDLDEYVSSDEFDTLYAYDGNDLGANYTKEYTTFNLWSPLADKVSLKLEKGDNSFLLYEMKREDRGVYSIRITGDLLTKKYSYIVRVNGREREIRDPYGKAVSLNSIYSSIVDLDLVKSLGTVKPENQIKKYNDAVIYELNIRDFTEAARDVNNKGTYLGVLEKIDYLKRLGITHVQLLPVLDFNTGDDIVKDTYNWGYDPISFFALEGSYSCMPEDPLCRMLEFKTLVNELHRNNIRVVVDVVYNHIYDYKTSDIQRNVPYYFFRRFKNRMSNASGCGNDIASERVMARKIIVDSCKFLTEVYDIDGFRFDLLGLIDVTTTNEIIKAVKSIKSDAILYGEGWHMGTNLPDDQKSSMQNAYKMPGMSFFNDAFRDLIKGSTFNKEERGYASGNTEYKVAVEQVILGSVLSNKFQNANQSINYVECHDNQTMFDKLSNICSNEADILKSIKFANALTILSLGIPFIHMGQEVGLSKFGLDNTYNVPKVNNMNWDLVESRKELVNSVAELIKFRRNLSIFNIDTPEEVAKIFDVFQLPNGVLNIAVRDKKYLNGYRKVVVIINPTDEVANVEFDEYFKLVFSLAGIIEKTGIIVKHYIASPRSLSIFALE